MDSRKWKETDRHKQAVSQTFRNIHMSKQSKQNELRHPVQYLVEGSHSLGELGLDLGQCFGPLQGLLELLLGVLQTLLELPVLLLTLTAHRTRKREESR